MFRKMKAGSTSQSVPIFVQDSTSTSGAGLGLLVYNTSGLAAKYRRQGESSWTTITLATMTLGTWASGGFVSDGGPVTGTYEFGIPNAVLASGAEWAEIAIYGATNMLAVLVFIELDVVNYQSATSFITGVNGVTPTVRTGTAQAGSLAGITLDASASSVDNHYRGLLLYLTGGTGAGQCRIIDGYTGSTKVASLEYPWTTTPDNTTTFAILPRGGPKSYSSGLDVGVGNTVSVEFINDDVIGPSVLSVEAKQNIASYVWAAVSRTLTAGTNIVLAKGTGITGFTDLDAAGVRTAIGLASANLDTQLAAIAGYIDTEVSAIKAKTDSLTFTVAGNLDCNVQYVNDVQVTGTGASGDEWGPP